MKRALFVIVLFLVFFCLFAALRFRARLNAPYRGYTEAEQFVDIRPGLSVGAIADALESSGVVVDEPTFRWALWWSGQSRHLKAGEYRFDQPMTPAQVIDKIARGDVFQVPVTFPEGLTIAEMAKIFQSSHAGAFISDRIGAAGAFVQAASDASLIKDLDPDAKDLEGYLFPDTYLLPRKTDPSKLIQQMVAAFRRALPSGLAHLPAGAGGKPLTVRQLVTLASIIEKETGKPEERRLVAAVYYNRLRIGMALQCDPTVIYALARAGRYDGNLHREDLALDSPYNTYRYPGLPPGPIASPGRASLEAAASPTGDEYLYFVSRNDGSHVFARTLDEHNRNVQKFQVQYFRERSRGSRGSSGSRRSGR